MLSCPLCHFPRRRRVGVVVSESMIPPFSADVGVGTIEDGCLDCVVLAASLPSALSSESMIHLFSSSAVKITIEA